MCTLLSNQWQASKFCCFGNAISPLLLTDKICIIVSHPQHALPGYIGLTLHCKTFSSLFNYALSARAQLL